jgi:flagellar basal body-associated protein FliL
MAAEENANKEEEQKKSKAPLFIGIGAGILIGAVVAGLLVYNLVDKNDSSGGDSTTIESNIAASTADAATSTKSKITNLGDINANLRNSRGVKLQMEVQLESKESVVAVIDERKPQLIDKIISLSRNQTSESLDGMDGKMTFSDEIHMHVNSILEPQKVDRVYFTKFIVTGN